MRENLKFRRLGSQNQEFRCRSYSSSASFLLEFGVVRTIERCAHLTPWPFLCVVLTTTTQKDRIKICLKNSIQET